MSGAKNIFFFSCYSGVKAAKEKTTFNSFQAPHVEFHYLYLHNAEKWAEEKWEELERDRDRDGRIKGEWEGERDMQLKVGGSLKTLKTLIT